jgi:tRNA(fMet)-specific endonuclease VapC
MRLLDTNICIYLINERPPQVLARLTGFAPQSLALSAITGAELMFGVAKSGSTRNRDALEKFLLPFPLLPFDGAAMQAYGPLRADLQRRGMPIGAMDMLIAAHALSLDAILVTNNTAEFERVSDLRLENWV